MHMTLSRVGATLALVAVTGAIGGVFTTLLTENALFLSSDWQTQAALSVGFVFLVLVVFAAIGTPWQRWSRTPYW